MARLITTVHVYDGADTIVYLPGQEVPQKHREQITAPGVWADGPDEHENVEPDTGEDGDLPVPPKAGRGSSIDAWRDYAEAQVTSRGLSIDIPSDAKREDIIAALDAYDIPTE